MISRWKTKIYYVLLPPKGDFYVDRHYLFEVGGRSKSFDQIKDVPDSFLAVDGTEVGRHKYSRGRRKHL